MILIEIGENFTKTTFRVVTIVPLQSLQRESREQGRVLDGVSSLPERNKDVISPESGGVSRGELKLYFIKFLLPRDVLT